MKTLLSEAPIALRGLTARVSNTDSISTEASLRLLLMIKMVCPPATGTKAGNHTEEQGAERSEVIF